jgi:exonuclease VII large subunit
MSPDIPPRPTPSSEARLAPFASLLNDLSALSSYLHQRSDKTYENAQRFANHARQSIETRAYDERQATMLEYQHQVWNEIAGLVDRLTTRYSEIHEAHQSED